MARAILCLLLAACLMPLPALAAAPAQAPGGYLIDLQNQKIVVERFEKLLDVYAFVFEDSQTSVPLSDVKSLTYLNDNNVRLENMKGEVFQVVGAMAICYTSEINYVTKNPIDGQEQVQTIDPMLVKKVVFNWKK